MRIIAGLALASLLTGSAGFAQSNTASSNGGADCDCWHWPITPDSCVDPCKKQQQAVLKVLKSASKDELTKTWHLDEKTADLITKKRQGGNLTLDDVKPVLTEKQFKSVLVGYETKSKGSAETLKTRMATTSSKSEAVEKSPPDN
jgi:hypothetical protein